MRALFLALIALLCACTSKLPGYPLGTPQSNAELATVVLVREAEEGLLGGPMCGAVAIGPHQLVTARHCIKRYETAFATRADWEHNRGFGIAQAVLGGVDEDNDLQLLETRETLTNTVSIRTDKLEPGDLVYSVHHGSQMPWSFVIGAVANGDRSSDAIHMVQADIAVSGGASGAGLFDEDGRLVGVCHGSDAGFAYFAAGWKVRDLVIQRERAQ